MIPSWSSSVPAARCLILWSVGGGTKGNYGPYPGNRIICRTVSFLWGAVNVKCPSPRPSPRKRPQAGRGRKAPRIRDGRVRAPRLIRGPGQGAGFGEFPTQLHPGIAGVMAGKQLAVVAAGEDPVRLRRVGRESPDR